MNLVSEKFKLITATYNGNDYMKIQYEDKDLVKKLKGEFHIIEVKKYGLRLVFTPDNEIIDKIYELGGYKNEENKKNIFLSMNKTTPFFNHKNILMDQNKCISKRDALKKIKIRGCVAVCFSSFSNSCDRLNAYEKQVKVNKSIEEEKIESMFDEED